MLRNALQRIKQTCTIYVLLSPAAQFGEVIHTMVDAYTADVNRALENTGNGSQSPVQPERPLRAEVAKLMKTFDAEFTNKSIAGIAR